jgi:hypothetical protein
MFVGMIGLWFTDNRLYDYTQMYGELTEQIESEIYTLGIISFVFMLVINVGLGMTIYYGYKALKNRQQAKQKAAI